MLTGTFIYSIYYILLRVFVLSKVEHCCFCHCTFQVIMQKHYLFTVTCNKIKYCSGFKVSEHLATTIFNLNIRTSQLLTILHLKFKCPFRNFWTSGNQWRSWSDAAFCGVCLPTPRDSTPPPAPPPPPPPPPTHTHTHTLTQMFQWTVLLYKTRWYKQCRPSDFAVSDLDLHRLRWSFFVDLFRSYPCDMVDFTEACFALTCNWAWSEKASFNCQPARCNKCRPSLFKYVSKHSLCRCGLYLHTAVVTRNNWTIVSQQTV